MDKLDQVKHILWAQTALKTFNAQILVFYQEFLNLFLTKKKKEEQIPINLFK
jgi:hypothetical protein